MRERVIMSEDGIIRDSHQDSDENALRNGSSVWCVNDPNKAAQDWDSDSSNNYIVMSIKPRKEEELKVLGAKLALKVNRYPTQALIESGLPISTCALG